MSRAPKNSSTLNMRPVWADVSLPALVHNFKAIRAYVNPSDTDKKKEKLRTQRKVLCIVKGNAYGHGGPVVAAALEKAGSDWFGVTCTEEGITLRKAGVRKPILILTSFVAGRRKAFAGSQFDGGDSSLRAAGATGASGGAARQEKSFVSFEN